MKPGVDVTSCVCREYDSLFLVPVNSSQAKHLRNVALLGREARTGSTSTKAKLNSRTACQEELNKRGHGYGRV